MLRLLAIALVSFLATAVTAGASELPAPTGPVVLTVSGAIAHTNIDGAAAFDQAMLDGLAQHTTHSETPWYDGARSFSGVLLSSVLEAVGAKGETMTATALNAYSAEIPVADVINDPVILASRVDGKLLSIRDKGPLFVIYPFDTNPELYNEVYFGRSVWQVASLKVH